MISPSSKMIVEVRIDESVCDTDRDARLSKEMVCYQLSKRLDRKIDSNVITVVMNVVKGMKNRTSINIYNFQDLRLYKRGAEDIKKIIRDELDSYLANPSKEIAQNKADDTEIGGALYKLLRNKGAALENKDADNQSRYQQEAISDYEYKCEQYTALRLSLELNKQLKEKHRGYSLVFVVEKNPFKPYSHIQLMRYDKPLMWLRMNTTADQVFSLLQFIEGFAGLSYINTVNGAKRKICETLGADEYLDDLNYQSTFIENSLDYNKWAYPKIADFLAKLRTEDEAEYAEDILPFYADIAWIDNLKTAALEVFTEESSKAKTIIINKVLMT